MSLHYYLRKANMFADALSQLYMESLAHVDKETRELVKDIYHLDNLGVCLLDSEDGGVFVQKVAEMSLGAKMKEKQMLNCILLRINIDVDGKKVVAF